MSKELSLEDFSLFERASHGGYSYPTSFPNENILVLTKAYLSVSKKAGEFIGLNKDSQIILAERQGVLYLAILPFDSKISGYGRLKGKKHDHIIDCFTVSKKLMDKIHPACYILLDPIIVSGMDFYELELFKEFRIKT